MRKWGCLYIAWVLAIAGLFLSFVFSQVFYWQACPFCWGQRMALIPLALMLGIAAYRDDSRFAIPGIFFAAIGFCLALYQLAFRVFPNFSLGCPDHGCAGGEIEIFGVVPIPLLSAALFALIGVFLGICRRLK